MRWWRKSNVQVSCRHAASAAPLCHFANEPFYFFKFFFLLFSSRCLMSFPPQWAVGGGLGGGGVKRRSVLLRKASFHRRGRSASIPMQGHECTFIYMHIDRLSNPPPPSLFSPLMHGRLLNLIYPPHTHLYKCLPSPPSPRPSLSFLSQLRVCVCEEKILHNNIRHCNVISRRRWNEKCHLTIITCNN